MSKLLRGIAAGWGAKKLGGGCFSTILVFILLGTCSATSRSFAERTPTTSRGTSSAAAASHSSAQQPLERHVHGSQAHAGPQGQADGALWAGRL